MGIKYSKSKSSYKKENLCKICLDKHSEYAYMPCGHYCVCKLCNDKILSETYNHEPKCIICKASASLYKIYEN